MSTPNPANSNLSPLRKKIDREMEKDVKARLVRLRSPVSSFEEKERGQSRVISAYDYVISVAKMMTTKISHIDQNPWAVALSNKWIETLLYLCP